MNSMDIKSIGRFCHKNEFDYMICNMYKLKAKKLYCVLLAACLFEWCSLHAETFSSDPSRQCLTPSHSPRLSKQ